jgi:hypothetical protein
MIGGVSWIDTPPPRVRSSCENGKGQLLLADKLHEHPFITSTIEFTVEDLFPGAEIEPTFRDGDHNLSTHDLSLEVCVGVILAGAIVKIALRALVKGSERLKPSMIVGMKSGLVVVNKHGRRYMHGVDETEPLLNPTLREKLFYVSRYINELEPFGGVKGKVVSLAFHKRRYKSELCPHYTMKSDTRKEGNVAARCPELASVHPSGNATP